MNPRPLLLSVLFIGFLFAAGDGIACEGCFAAGQTLPSGGVSSKVTCYTYDAGAEEGCYVQEGYNNCTMWSNNDDACPVPPPGGGGGGNGGSSGGGTGGNCRRDSSGACPPECMSCGPINNM